MPGGRTFWATFCQTVYGSVKDEFWVGHETWVVFLALLLALD